MDTGVLVSIHLWSNFYFSSAINQNMHKQIINKQYLNTVQVLQYLFFLILMGCTVSNQKEVKKNLYNIDVEAIIKNLQNVKLSEIATDITYLPLETGNDNLINRIKKVKLTDNYIFVSERNNILKFNTCGRYIGQIGKTGYGPGEYVNIMNFEANEKANIIIINDEFRSYKYDINGNFLGEVKLPSTNYLFFSPTKFAFYLTNYIGKLNNLVITDNNFTPLYQFQNNHPRPETHLKFGGSPFYVFRRNLFFKEYFNDTVFCVNDSLLKPHIIYKEKNLIFDKNFDLHSTGNVSDLIKQIEKVNDKLMTNSIFETKKYVFTSYIKGLNPRNTNYARIIFNKEINKAFALNEGKFINDIDNGCNFWPTGCFQDSILFSYINAFELKAHVASNAFINSTPRYPEKKKALEELADSLNEDDNPVLMLVKLKE